MSAEIRRIFLMDVSSELTHDRTTATQVIMSREELNKATGGLLATFDQTTLRPIVMTTIHQLVDDGVFTDDVIDLIQKGDVTIDVKSGMEALGRESQYRNIIEWIAEVGQVIPGALDAIDPVAMVRWSAQARGIPNEIIKSDSQISEENQQRLQAELNSGIGSTNSPNRRSYNRTNRTTS